MAHGPEIVYTVEVVSKTGYPLAGVTVETTWDSIHILWGRTDRSGRVQFRVPDGICLIYINANGHQAGHLRNVWRGQVDQVVLNSYP